MFVGIWSVIGGSMVPAVMFTLVIVVSVTSMAVAVSMCTGSCLVGVMIVVCRLFSTRKW